MAGRMASLGDRLIREALRRGERKGLGEGSRVWLVLGTAAVVVRLLQRLPRGKPIVVTEELAPGQALIITHLERESR